MEKGFKAFQDTAVEEVFNAYPNRLREKLMLLRQMIFDTASETKGVDELEETLKWGQPSYLTTRSKSGSTIRIDSIKSDDQKYAIYFNCKTTLVDTFREIYPDQFHFEGNRTIIFDLNNEIPISELSDCIAIALTYHLNKRHVLRN